MSRAKALVILLLGACAVIAWLITLKFAGQNHLSDREEISFVSGPSHPEGGIDFRAAINARRRDDTKPDDNAVIPFIQCHGLEETGYLTQDVAEFLDFDGEVEYESERLNLSLFLYKYYSRLPEEDEDSELNSGFVTLHMETQAWTDSFSPIGAQWFRDNEPTLDKLCKGLCRPNWYAPRLKFYQALPSGFSLCMSNTYHTLAARGNFYAAIHDVERAIETINALLWLSKHSTYSGDLLPYLRAAACREATAICLQSLIEHNSVSEQTIESIRSVANQTREVRPLDEYIDTELRLAGLYRLDMIARRETTTSLDLLLGARVSDRLAFDSVFQLTGYHNWDVDAKQLNRFCDHLLELMESGDEVRFKELDETFQRRFHSDPDDDDAWRNNWNLQSDAFSVAKATLRRFLPSLISSDRMLQIVFALEEYHLEHDRYPDQLTELESLLDSPSLLIEPFSKSHYLYESFDDGYRLKSLGSNLKDDDKFPSSTRDDLTLELKPSW